jgi:hypothetical protein
MELCDPPKYDGLNDIRYFVKAFDFQIPKQKRLLALDFVLKDTLAKWWVSHKEAIEDWKQCKSLM